MAQRRCFELFDQTSWRNHTVTGKHDKCLLRWAQVCMLQALLLRSVKGTTLRKLWRTRCSFLSSALAQVAKAEAEHLWPRVGSCCSPCCRGASDSQDSQRFSCIMEPIGLEQPMKTLQLPMHVISRPKPINGTLRCYPVMVSFMGRSDQPAGIEEKTSIISAGGPLASDVISSRRISDSVSPLGFVHRTDLHMRGDCSVIHCQDVHRCQCRLI